MEEDRQESIEYYINKLQNLLSKVIAESEEYNALKNLVNSDNGDLQLCVFSILMDKKNAESLKQMDPQLLQKWLLEEDGEGEPLDVDWSDSDREFLKKYRITF